MLRSITHHTLPLLALAAVPSLGAQQAAAQATVPIRIIVQPVLAIRSVVPAPARLTPSTQINSAAIVNVESNLPYRLTVRLAPTIASANARVLVRGASGVFEPLAPGASITAVARGTPGQQGHEIACRVESGEADRCALIYELSAEYHDMVIRSTATATHSYVLRPSS